jgi:hypothetical protein
MLVIANEPMDLTYVLCKDTQRLKQAEALGYDQEAMFLLCEELFKAAEELSLSNKELAQVFYRLRDVQDYALGRQLEPDLVLYDNSPQMPTRVAVEDKRAQRTTCFTVKAEGMVKCDRCQAEVTRSAAKTHVAQRHL